MQIECKTMKEMLRKRNMAIIGYSSKHIKYCGKKAQRKKLRGTK